MARSHCADSFGLDIDMIRQYIKTSKVSIETSGEIEPVYIDSYGGQLAVSLGGQSKPLHGGGARAAPLKGFIKIYRP